MLKTRPNAKPQTVVGNCKEPHVERKQFKNRNMKKLFILGILLVSTYTFAQDKNAVTEDGKKVILKPNKTWEYATTTTTTTTSESDCVLDANYVEPKSEKGINSWLKKFDATTDDLKKHVAVENDCKVEDVKLLDISEQKGNGMYKLCVKGKIIKYRRTGSAFSRLDENILKPKD